MKTDALFWIFYGYVLNSTVLVLFWLRSGSVFLSRFGSVLHMLCSSSVLFSGSALIYSGPLLFLSWFCSGSVLVLFCFCSGSVLVLFWFCSGSVLVLFWFSYGSLLVLFWFLKLQKNSLGGANKIASTI
jgi:hypothetical protein